MIINEMFVAFEPGDWTTGRAREFIDLFKRSGGCKYFPLKKQWKVDAETLDFINNQTGVVEQKVGPSVQSEMLGSDDKNPEDYSGLMGLRKRIIDVEGFIEYLIIMKAKENVIKYYEDLLDSLSKEFKRLIK